MLYDKYIDKPTQTVHTPTMPKKLTRRAPQSTKPAPPPEKIPRVKHELSNVERAHVMSLRRAGHGYEDIAKDTGLSRNQIISFVNAAIKTHNRDLRDMVDDLAALEVQRLDALQTAIWDRAMDGNLDAIDKVLKIQAHRAKLLGLYRTVPQTGTDIHLHLNLGGEGSEGDGNRPAKQITRVEPYVDPPEPEIVAPGAILDVGDLEF